jgi:membrane AbrB-like protein
VIKKYLAIFVISCIGGWLFSLIHFPLPWTLGPLATVIIIKLGFKQAVYWPMKIRNIAMLVLGYVMGSPFTPQTGQHILSQLPAMSIMTLLTIVLCLSGGYIIGKYLDLHISTSLIGSMPGGLAQMAIVCEDVEGSDAAAVTLMQTVRVITTVFFVPFLVLHGLADHVDPITRTAAQQFSADKFPVLFIFAAVIVGLVYVGKYIRMPSPYLIAPVVGTAILVLSGVDAPALPPSAIALAQICIGIRMGMAVELSSLANWKKLLTLNFISVFTVILIFSGIDYIYAMISGTSFVTAFISTAPGGITEMGLTAMMVHADLSTVIAFQLFRLLFVLLVAVPLIRWWLCRTKKACITYCPLE